jgi:hypothetical protein
VILPPAHIRAHSIDGLRHHVFFFQSLQRLFVAHQDHQRHFVGDLAPAFLVTDPHADDIRLAAKLPLHSLSDFLNLFKLGH